MGHNKDFDTMSKIAMKVWVGSILYVFLFNDTDRQSNNKAGSLKGAGFKAWLSNWILQSEPENQVKICIWKFSSWGTADTNWGKSTGTEAVTAEQSCSKRWKHHKHPSSLGIKCVHYNKIQCWIVSKILLTYTVSLETRPGW